MTLRIAAILIAALTALPLTACSEPTCPDGYELDANKEYCRRIPAQAGEASESGPSSAGSSG